MSVWGLLIGMWVGIKYQSTDDSEAVIWEEPIQNEWWLNEAGIFELCAWLAGSLTCQRVSSRQFYWSFSSRMVWVSSLALTPFVNLRREKIWISGQFQGLPGTILSCLHPILRSILAGLNVSIVEETANSSMCCGMYVEVTEQSGGVMSLFLPCGSRGWNSGHQAWQ